MQYVSIRVSAVVRKILKTAPLMPATPVPECSFICCVLHYEHPFAMFGAMWGGSGCGAGCRGVVLCPPMEKSALWEPSGPDPEPQVGSWELVSDFSGALGQTLT